jgi:protein-S-isoprenylcysteine O-methyltransferase Ste14
MALADPIAVPKAAAAPAPASTIPYRDGYWGLAGLGLAWGLARMLQLDALVAAPLVLLATALPMLALEWRRAGPAPRRRQTHAPLAYLVGLGLALAPFLAVHAQAQGIWAWLVAALVAAPALGLRLGLEAVRNGAVSGGFPAALGQALLPPRRDRLAALAPAARLFALKAFFIPLYGASLFALVKLGLGAAPATPGGWLLLAVVLAYTIDLGFGLAGYVFASNDLVPTVRSTQRLALGWLACLVCYGPVFAHWPDFAMVVQAEIGWPGDFAATAATAPAAVALLGLLALYVSASVHFGLRFSNLCNRGVLAAGPYRYMKHPAYFAHVANAWLLCLVLLPASGAPAGPTLELVPVAFTLFYWLRARTEEQHMREDPAYAAYADWIAQNGVLAWVRRQLGL